MTNLIKAFQTYIRPVYYLLPLALKQWNRTVLMEYVMMKRRTKMFVVHLNLISHSLFWSGSLTRRRTRASRSSWSARSTARRRQRSPGSREAMRSRRTRGSRPTRTPMASTAWPSTALLAAWPESTKLGPPMTWALRPASATSKWTVSTQTRSTKYVSYLGTWATTTALITYITFFPSGF